MCSSGGDAVVGFAPAPQRLGGVALGLQEPVTSPARALAAAVAEGAADVDGAAGTRVSGGQWWAVSRIERRWLWLTPTRRASSPSVQPVPVFVRAPRTDARRQPIAERAGPPRRAAQAPGRRSSLHIVSPDCGRPVRFARLRMTRVGAEVSRRRARTSSTNGAAPLSEHPRAGLRSRANPAIVSAPVPPAGALRFCGLRELQALRPRRHGGRATRTRA
jgi:hypothetical protein